MKSEFNAKQIQCKAKSMQSKLNAKQIQCKQIQCIAFALHCFCFALLLLCIAFALHCFCFALLLLCFALLCITLHCIALHCFALLCFALLWGTLLLDAGEPCFWVPGNRNLEGPSRGTRIPGNRLIKISINPRANHQCTKKLEPLRQSLIGEKL